MPASAETLGPMEGLWTSVRHELELHAAAHCALLACLVLLAGARLLLAPADRRRLRFPLGAFLVYLACLPIHALLDERGFEGGHRYLSLGSNMVLAFGFVAVGGIVFFDLLGRRLARLRILRDVTMIGADI